MCFFPVLHSFLLSEESDYHTDYEEEALESALSDMELYNHYGEHTEGEETGDTVRIAARRVHAFASCDVVGCIALCDGFRFKVTQCLLEMSHLYILKCH